MYVYTALFKALNIHHQSKMHKQDKITNKTSKQNVLQHLDPEEPLTWLKEKRIKRSDFQGFDDFKWSPQVFFSSKMVGNKSVRYFYVVLVHNVFGLISDF